VVNCLNLMSDIKPAESIFRHEIVVPDTAIDPNGHVNNVVFVQWMQDVAVLHFDSVVGMRRTKEAGQTWVVRSHQVEYLSPAFVGDRIIVMTWIANFSRVRSLRRYRFLRAEDGKLLVRGETDWVFVSIATGRPTSIPEEIRCAFSLVDEA
jgi:acyl-CoA thioester hydrolase